LKYSWWSIGGVWFGRENKISKAKTAFFRIFLPVLFSYSKIECLIFWIIRTKLWLQLWFSIYLNIF
jgi:hypothetical protein